MAQAVYYPNTSLEQIASRLERARITGDHGSACCPAHDDASPSLALWAWADGVCASCRAGCPRAALEAALAASGVAPGRRRGCRVKPLAERQRLAAEASEAASEAATRAEAGDRYARQIVRQCLPASECKLARRYFTSRGINPELPPDILYCSRLKHTQTDTYWPAIVAVISNVEGEFLAIHRTYLSADGSAKADVSPNKMMLGHLADGAVHLGDPTDALAIAEGLETGLSFQELSGIPTWAALSASRLGRVRLPPSVRSLTIIADHDEPGIRAVQAARRAYAAMGLDVRVLLPELPGADVNDVVRREAAP